MATRDRNQSLDFASLLASSLNNLLRIFPEGFFGISLMLEGSTKGNKEETWVRIQTSSI